MSRAELDALRGSGLVVYVRPPNLFADRTARKHCMSMLSGLERARMERFAAQEAADLFLAAHALLRCLLGQLLDCAPQALTFRAAPGGRPELAGAEDNTGIRFNLAHTSGLAACGLTLGSQIGVDVEHLSRNVPLPALAARVCSRRELSAMSPLSAAERRRRFAELWTLKEAYVKATGIGIATSLRSLSFAAEQPDPVPLSFESPSTDDPERWCMRRLALQPEHCLAVALRSRPAANVRWREWDGSALRALVAP